MHYFKGLASSLFAIVLAGLFLVVPANYGQQDINKLHLDKVPKKVMNALKSKFPRAEIHKWTKEKEGNIVVYDFEFKQDDQNFEADIKEDGTIHNWEKAIGAKDLPEAVKKAVEKMYPQSILKEIMMITAIKDGKDALEGYEIVLETADKKEVEVMVAPDGKILEESDSFFPGKPLRFFPDIIQAGLHHSPPG